MADNYLEKKYEELKRGKPVVRRSTPSLDTLFKRLASAADIDLSYTVKQAQLDALVRSAGRLGDDCVFETFETSANSAAIVRISCPCGPWSLAQAVLAVRLKAAELGLDSSVETVPPSELSGSPACATVIIFRRSGS